MPTPQLDIYDRNWPVWTYQQQLPPAKFVFDDEDRRGIAVDSMVSGGCIVSGARVARSLLFSSVRINSFAQTCEAVLLPEVEVGRYARLNKVVVDRGCRFPEGLVCAAEVIPPTSTRKWWCLSLNCIGCASFETRPRGLLRMT